ncbi:hypothetical protein Leryth_010303 [Lithospermum erythrorhizon]|nr:hypothetical protein Leryth_010303 [Lithospermum erythrorhizon]
MKKPAEDQLIVNQHTPPAGYPTDENIPTGKKKRFFSRSKPKAYLRFVAAGFVRCAFNKDITMDYHIGILLEPLSMHYIGVCSSTSEHHVLLLHFKIIMKNAYGDEAQ